MFRFLLTVVLCLVSHEARSVIATGWTPCDAANGEVVDVRVTPPSGDNDLVYRLRRGTNVTLHVDFNSFVASETARAKSYALVMRMPVSLTMPHDDICRGTGVLCPLEPGTTNKYTQPFEVKVTYPKVKVTVKWTAVDDKGDVMACAMIPVEIVD